MGRPGGRRAGVGERWSRRARGQAGLTLIESLAALVLASLVVLALAAGMFTLMRTTNLTSKAQRMEAALTTASETVKGLPYIDCADAATYTTAAGWDVPGPGARATAIDVEYWDGTPAGTTIGSFQSSCTSEHGAQRVTVAVTLDGDTRTTDIVKRRSAAP